MSVYSFFIFNVIITEFLFFFFKIIPLYPPQQNKYLSFYIPYERQYMINIKKKGKKNYDNTSYCYVVYYTANYIIFFIEKKKIRRRRRYKGQQND